jgi:hypothetical protein
MLRIGESYKLEKLQASRLAGCDANFGDGIRTIAEGGKKGEVNAFFRRHSHL